jgi:hypothetical protein
VTCDIRINYELTVHLLYMVTWSTETMPLVASDLAKGTPDNGKVGSDDNYIASFLTMPGIRIESQCLL